MMFIFKSLKFFKCKH